MNIRLKIILIGLMASALFFGFLHNFVPGKTVYSFERLHIFLFNLCSGGTILILYSEARDRLSLRGILFLSFSLLYALLAFFEFYLAAIPVAFLLAVIVDSVRIQKFSLLPLNFFDSRTPVSEKFHQASLLCLSIGLLLSGLVIWNNEYLKLVSFSKLTLNTFFLGFSFPLSLISLSVVFSHMRVDLRGAVVFLKNMGFWNINLGVIIFFLFILLENLTLQLIVTTILFLSVVMIFFLYYHLGHQGQQKSFLTSGIFFLLYTSLTGIAYIVLEFYQGYDPEKMKWLLRLHSFASLYGWNLSGLAVICRENDFPIRLNSRGIIVIHWLTAIFLAPLGTDNKLLAGCALIGYVFILYRVLFSRGNGRLRENR